MEDKCRGNTNSIDVGYVKSVKRLSCCFLEYVFMSLFCIILIEGANLLPQSK